MIRAHSVNEWFLLPPRLVPSKEVTEWKRERVHGVSGGKTSPQQYTCHMIGTDLLFLKAYSKDL